MLVRETIVIRSPLERVRSVVDDLTTYPDWLEIVGAAAPGAPEVGDPGPAWQIDLRAQLGPLRRSKRLRMVRVEAAGIDTSDAPGSSLVRFERRETDGRSHSMWRLDAELVPVGTSREDAGGDETSLTMALHYDGSLWLPMLDRLLAEEIRRARRRLPDVIATR